MHFSGHGEHQGRLYLAVRGSERGRLLRASSVDMDDLLEDAKQDGTPVLFLLDVCGAGHALTGDLVEDLKLAAGARAPDGSSSRGAWVIGACAAGETTRQALFSRATATVLRRLADGALDISPALEHVPVSTFATEVARELALDDGLGQSVVHTPQQRALEEVPGFFPNPAYARDAPDRFLAGVDTVLRQLALATDPELDLLHFATRAAGNQRGDVCQFSGRTSHLARIRTWLEDPDGDQERLLLVTGGPGTGKSALLGVTTCLLHPALRPLRRRVRARVTGFAPRTGARILAVHARQLTVGQITDSLLRQLADQIAADETSQDGTPTEELPSVRTDREVLDARLRAAGPVVVVLDALDEAADPAAVVRDLILPLSGVGGRDVGSQCRVLAATRPWWSTLDTLGDHVAAHPARLLPLDPDTDRDRLDLADDLTEYLALLLDEDYPETTPRLIADRLARDAGTGAFLIAALFAGHLLQQADAGTPLTDDQVRSSLPCEITDVFDLHTRTLAAEDPWVLPVLHVLGQARGQGMPLELVHAAALAHSPAPDDGRSLRPAVEDTRKALRKAAFYLRTTPDTDHRLLYRYFHQALTDHAAPAADPQVVHRALTGVPRTTSAGTPDWELAHPYLKRHAAQHAAAAGIGALDQLLEDPLFLLHADPDTLAPYLPLATSTTALEHARIYRTTTTHHRDRHRATTRRDLLALDAATWRRPDLARTLAGLPLNHRTALLVPLWATSRTADAAIRHTLLNPLNNMSALAAAVRSDGRAFALLAGATVQVWDPVSGVYLRSFDGHPTYVLRAETAVLPDGRALAVTGDKAGTVLVWDPFTGEQLLRAVEHHDRWGIQGLELATAVLPDGRAFVATNSSGSGFTVKVWDLMTGNHLHDLRDSTLDKVLTTAVTRQGRALLLMASKRGGKASVWDLDTGDSLHTLGNWDMQVEEAKSAVLPEAPAVVVTRLQEGRLAVWNLETGEHLHDLPAPAKPSSFVRALATAVLPDGRALLVRASNTDDLATVDLMTGETVYTHTGGAGATSVGAALVTPDGHALAVTTGGGYHRSRRAVVWEMDPGEHARPLTRADSPLRSVVMVEPPGSKPLLVTVGMQENDVKVWDLATGEFLRAPSIPSSRVLGLAAVVLPDGIARVITTDTDQETLVWDPNTGEALHSLSGHPFKVCDVAAVVLPDGRGRVITIDPCTVRVWDLVAGEPLYTLGEYEGLSSVAAVALPDGRVLGVVAGEYGYVHVWDLHSGAP
ncbi:AAA family ATPase [Streptomyces nojiriensis]